MIAVSGRRLPPFLEGLVAIGLVLSLTSVALTQESAGLANSPWPKFKRDARNTGQSPHPSIVDPFVKWTYLTNHYVRSSPVIGPDGTVYVGSEDHSLYALNRDGTLRWSFETWGEINAGGPAIAADGTVYVGSIDTTGPYLGRLYALNPDGSLKWTFDAGSCGYDSVSPALGPDGTVYFGAGRLYAVHPDGTLKWGYQTGREINATPAVAADGTVLVLAADGKLYAINPDGSRRWIYKSSGWGANLWSSPAVGPDGTVYFGTVGDNRVYAVNPDGNLKWTFQGSTWIRRSPSIAPDGTIYVGEDYGWYGGPQSGFKLYALNPDGSLKWSFEPYSAVGSSVSIAADGILYFASMRHLYALNPEGAVEWEMTLDSGGVYESSPAIDIDGTIYIGSYDNKLYAISGQIRTVTATIDCEPDTLNLKGKGKWVTCYIELPPGHGVNDISLASVAVTVVDGSPITPIYAESSPTGLGDYDCDTTPDLMVKIDRQLLQQQLDAGRVALEVSGNLINGFGFKGLDSVTVIH